MVGVRSEGECYMWCGVGRGGRREYAIGEDSTGWSFMLEGGKIWKTYELLYIDQSNSNAISGIFYFMMP